MQVYIVSASFPFMEASGRKKIFSKRAFLSREKATVSIPEFLTKCEPQPTDLLTWKVEEGDVQILEFEVDES